MDRLRRQQLLKLIRDALNHLEDPGYLRKSPLARMLDVADRFDTPSVLRRVLTDAIASLEPPAHTRAEAHAWRVYESVYYRYVEAYEQEAVAQQLGVSVRQLRREQQVAFEALALRLNERYGLQPDHPQPAAPGGQGAPEVERLPQALSQELTWLKEAPPAGPADLRRTLQAVTELVQPLADRRGVALQLSLPAHLPQLAVDPVGLRQVLLNLLGVAIPHAAQRGAKGEVAISACRRKWEVEIRVQCTDGAVQAEDVANRLEMARQLANLCGGKLAVALGSGSFAATLALPALQQLPVLAIDDNEGTLELWQRYAEGTRYRLVGTRDPDQALPLAQRLVPQVILLDVMMPGIDGWDVLVRLRHHPLTSHIPVIVCTILMEEELALSLGASALLNKPLTRQAFLAALDEQVALLA